jgi:hypothetical protein
VTAGVARRHIFKPKIPIWVNFLAMEDVGILYGHLVHFKTILLPFGIFYGYLVYISHFGKLYKEKSGNPGCNLKLKL